MPCKAVDNSECLLWSVEWLESSEHLSQNDLPQLTSKFAEQILFGICHRREFSVNCFCSTVSSIALLPSLPSTSTTYLPSITDCICTIRTFRLLITAVLVFGVLCFVQGPCKIPTCRPRRIHLSVRISPARREIPLIRPQMSKSRKFLVRPKIRQVSTSSLTSSTFHLVSFPSHPILFIFIFFNHT